MRQVPVENLLPNLRHALRAQRIGRPRPAQRRLRLFVRLEQRFFRPLRRRRRIRLDAIQALEYRPCPLGGDDNCFLYVLDRLAHDSFWLLAFSFWPLALGLWLFLSMAVNL